MKKQALSAMLEKLVAQPGASAANVKAALGVLTSLVAGLDVVEAQPAAGGSSLLLTLQAGAVGEIATRSRAPAELYVAPELRLSAAADGASLVVRLDGLSAGPVEGAMDVWLKLKDKWMAAGAGPRLLALTADGSQTEVLQEVAWVLTNLSGVAEPPEMQELVDCGLLSTLTVMLFHLSLIHI